jgi:hypothetical protein
MCVVERRRADGVLDDRVGGEQGEPLVLASGGNRGHGSSRSAAGGVIIVGRFPGNRASHNKTVTCSRSASSTVRPDKASEHLPDFNRAGARRNDGIVRGEGQ